jgi:hypothetical protein
LTAVEHLAFALPLEVHEPAPLLFLGGKRHALARWFSGRHQGSWLGAALVDVRGLAPGSYSLELRLQENAPFRRVLVRL